DGSGQIHDSTQLRRRLRDSTTGFFLQMSLLQIQSKSTAIVLNLPRLRLRPN
ncbi:hypothetical protein ISN45_Aa04g003550, partial [Arabidopsis thaliana x Arabidopsis arenosa]